MFQQGDIVYWLDGPGLYKINATRHGSALITTVTEPGIPPRIVRLSRLAQVAAAPIPA
mgnify:CR=1 FL=1